MALQRASYTTVIGLVFQSYHFEQAATQHLLIMGNAARKAATFNSAAENDNVVSAEIIEKSTADKLQSESIRKHSIALQKESKEDTLQAQADRLSSREFTAKAAEEESQANLYEATALAEERIYELDTKKALREAAVVTESEARIEADGVATGFCEFIPGLDILCDLVGGATAVRMQTSAVTSSAESAVDFAAAASAKENEDANLVASEGLHAQAENDGQMEIQLESEADEEQMKADTTAAAAKKEEMQADAKFAESKEEEALSKKEALKADYENEESSRLWKKSIVHGLAAFWDGILSVLISSVAFLFFAFRVYIAIIVPCVAELLCTTLLQAQSEHIVNARLFSEMQFFRKFSYFLLHCGVFFTAMILFFPNFYENLDDLNIRSKGGVILIFSFFVGSLQSMLLHMLPYCTRVCRTASIMNSTAGNIWIFFVAIVHLMPLVIMETISLWVLFGHDILLFNLRPNPMPYVLGLLISVIFHVYLFEGKDSSGHGDGNGFGVLLFKSEFYVDHEKKANESAPLLKVAEGHGFVESYCSGEDVGTLGNIRNEKIAPGSVVSQNTQERCHISWLYCGRETLERIHVTCKLFFSDLQFPFEILIICCTFSLLKSSIPICQRLLPIFRNEFLHTHTNWSLTLMGILLSIGLVILLWGLHQTSKNKSSLHFGLLSGESLRRKLL